jgi:hypothetical protein
MAFRISPLAAVLALGAAAAPARAQSSDALAPASLALTSPAAAPAPAALKTAYRLRLTSMWPQDTGTPGCRNGGEETLEGTLTRNPDGTYSGMFARRTELLFCGAHGQAGSACSLALLGKGAVMMSGVVMADETSPSGRSIRATWTPAAGHEAAVSGACASGFMQAVRDMYLSTPHAAEFPLTTVGEGPRTEVLESYAWMVKIE